MPYLFSFPRYHTKCVIEFFFRQLMTSWTLRFVFDHRLKQWLAGRKRERTEIINIEYLENEMSFLNEIKSIFHSFWRAIIWWNNKNLMKIADTSVKFFSFYIKFFSKPIVAIFSWYKIVSCLFNFIQAWQWIA